MKRTARFPWKIKNKMTPEDFQKLISIPVDDVTLEGMLAIPKGARGLVIFSHGSGSSRLSPRNNFVAEVIRNAGLGTLLFEIGRAHV